MNYAASQLTKLEAEYATRNEADRLPIEPSFVGKVADCMEEYGQDNDLPEGWWLEQADEEDTAYYVATILLDPACAPQDEEYV